MRERIEKLIDRAKWPDRVLPPVIAIGLVYIAWRIIESLIK